MKFLKLTEAERAESKFLLLWDLTFLPPSPNVAKAATDTANSTIVAILRCITGNMELFSFICKGKNKDKN